jgi:preprotein translocase subunit SecY
MDKFFEKIRLVFKDNILRKRILITLGLLAVFRLLAAVPVPGIDPIQLKSFFANNQLASLFNIFSGGALSNVSIVMLGVGPYITATIIMQLMTLLSPKLKAMYQEEGQAGRAKFAQYSRMITVPLAMLQAFAFISLLQQRGVFTVLTRYDLVRDIAIVTAGSLLLMWIGERISEYGIGNGTSLIIFAGIVASLPRNLLLFRDNYVPALIPAYIGLLAASLVVIYAVVVITEAERPIPVTYAKRVRGNKIYGGVSTYLPLRLNQAGVIPIIFALSILLFPKVIFQYLTRFSNPFIHNISLKISQGLENQLIYGILYFVLVFAFTYFYTAVTFEPNTISENLQKNGAFIPGVRPGQSTSFHISKILTRLTAFGALFLAIIAVLPLIVEALATGLPKVAIGGTALLIVVSVVIDLIKKTEAQVSMKEY